MYLMWHMWFSNLTAKDAKVAQGAQGKSVIISFICVIRVLILGLEVLKFQVGKHNPSLQFTIPYYLLHSLSNNQVLLSALMYLMCLMWFF
jgi:hypothetical protein